MREERYSAQGINPPMAATEKQPQRTTEILERLSQVYKSLSVLRDKLQNNADRLAGSRPTAAQVGQVASPEPAAIISKIQHSLGDVRVLLDTCHEEADRFNEI